MLQKMSIALMTVAVAAAGSRVGVAQDASKVEKGKAVFAEQKCKICHSVAGVGNPKGPLDDVGSKLTAEEIKQWLKTPKEMAEKAKATRKPPMKSFATLPPAQLDALAAYLATLKK
jgi:mono/diheme cytochrome c family protein